MASQNVLVRRGDGILVEQATVSLKDDWCFAQCAAVFRVRGGGRKARSQS